jgi:catechol-2,3-dioxygenase
MAASKWQPEHLNNRSVYTGASEGTMAEAISSRPQVNGILETSLYVERPTRSVEFYRRVFGFEPIDTDPKADITDQTRLCAMRAGDRSVLLLFKKGATQDTNVNGAIHVAFGISRSELPAWEAWLSQQGIPIELRKTWKYGGEALYFRDPDGHLVEVVTPGVWSIF